MQQKGSYYILRITITFTCKKISYCRDSARQRSLRCSVSFKVIDVGTNQKPVCNFILVNNTNLHPISCRWHPTRNSESHLETNHTVAKWDETLSENTWPAQRLQPHVTNLHLQTWCNRNVKLAVSVIIWSSLERQADSTTSKEEKLCIGDGHSHVSAGPGLCK